VHWTCRSCGEVHEGLPLDWGFDAPAHWDGPRSADDWLGSDLCAWTNQEGEKAYFIRGVLEIPILDSDEVLVYGAWSSLSETSFDRVWELWDDPARVEEPPYFGWLSNGIRGYPQTLNLPLDVVTAELDFRPKLVLHEGNHPLVAEQSEGISWARVRDLVEIHLHGE
jgi:hypothetical protein